MCSNYADSKFLSLSQENLSFSLFLFSSPLYFEGMYVNWMLVMRLQGLSFFILSLPLSLFLSFSLSIHLGLVISQSPPHSSATQDAADGPQEVAGV